VESATGFADNEPAHMQQFRSRDMSRVFAGLQQNPDGTVQGSRTLDLLNVKYLLYRPESPSGMAPLGIVPNRSVLPRAWLASALEARPLDTHLDRILDTSFAYRQALLIDPAEAKRDPIAQSLVGKTPDTASAGTVVYTQQNWDNWTYTVNSKAPAILALSEPWYPHWNVTIDGKPAPLLRVNYALRGIAVPAGQHTVTMSFESPWFELGKKLSLLSVLLLGLWAGGMYWWERKSAAKAA
jgi:hypothetical protein